MSKWNRSILAALPQAGGVEGKPERCLVEQPEKGGRIATAPSFLRRKPSANYATVFIFSAATATRLLSGWAISPASFIMCSVEREVSATIESKAERAKSDWSFMNSVGDLTDDSVCSVWVAVSKVRLA